MTEPSALVENILRRQNSEGGWGFTGGGPSSESWTEPTALALLALEAAGAVNGAYERGRKWLLNTQRNDGGWSPCAAVNSSTWVTSASLLALSSFAGREIQTRATRWLLAQVKPDLNPIQRLEFWMADMPSNEFVAGGSPWFPGTAAWVAPTVMTTIALAQAARKSSTPDLHVPVRRATEYLLSRRCPDGGWNHGGTSVRSAAAFSYPEMTGMALLAIPPGIPTLSHTLAVAEQMFRRPGSSEGQSWLHLGLLKHGRRSNPTLEAPPPCRTTRDLCLQLLAVSGGSLHDNLLTAVS